jgi:hypothetical protein
VTAPLHATLTIVPIVTLWAIVSPAIDAPVRPLDAYVVSVYHDRAAKPADSSAVLASASDGEVEAASGAVDLYGNEVIDAVSTYKLDEAGDLYEVHSPELAMPKLAAPEG